jgi:hypothetical protein
LVFLFFGKPPYKEFLIQVLDMLYEELKATSIRGWCCLKADFGDPLLIISFLFPILESDMYVPLND